jgi:hypothetical protein
MVAEQIKFRMVKNNYWRLTILLCMAGQGFAGQENDLPFRKEIAEINRQCPAEYPEIVAVLPEAGAFSAKSDAELIGMLDNWNPAFREAVGKELAQRGDKCVPALKKALRSKNWQVRSGAAAALSHIINPLLTP